MTPTKTTAVYFSPTATSQKGVLAIANTICPDGNYKQIDLTLLHKRPAHATFTSDELVVFGAPVYGGRLFSGCTPAFGRLQGNATPCIITVTYGNRDYDDALLEFSDLVRAQGFVPVAAAALIGEHTFGEIALGRPNADDLAQDKAFAAKVAEKLKAISAQELTQGTILVDIPGNKPYRDGGNKGNFLPSTLDHCINCGMCAKRCTMGAIDPQNVHNIDPEKCISCFRCIKACPVRAKVCNSEAYLSFAEGFTARLAARRENEYFL